MNATHTDTNELGTFEGFPRTEQKERFIDALVSSYGGDRSGYEWEVYVNQMVAFGPVDIDDYS